MTFTEQLKQSRLSFCETRTTHELEARYGEGESATTITITVKAVIKAGAVEGVYINYFNLVMPITRVSYAVMRKYPGLNPMTRAGIEQNLLEHANRSTPRGWVYRAGEFLCEIDSMEARTDTLCVGIGTQGGYSGNGLRQYALSAVAELLDYADELASEWLANNKE